MGSVQTRQVTTYAYRRIVHQINGYAIFHYDLFDNFDAIQFPGTPSKG